VRLCRSFTAPHNLCIVNKGIISRYSEATGTILIFFIVSKYVKYISKYIEPCFDELLLKAISCRVNVHIDLSFSILLIGTVRLSVIHLRKTFTCKIF